MQAWKWMVGGLCLISQVAWGQVFGPSELKECEVTKGRKNYAECNFREKSLAEMDLRGMDFSNADLVKVDFWKANLAGANLSGANLAGANIQEANFSGANLTGVNMPFANLSDADFSNTNLTSAYLYRITSFNTKFDGAILAGAIWEDGIRCNDQSKGTCQATQATDKIEIIYVISSERANATNTDGTGLYVDLIKQIYEDSGIKVKLTSAPYSRSVRSVEQKQVDSMLGVPVKSVEAIMYSNVPIDMDVTSAIFKKDKITEWKGQESLNGRKVGWLRGHEFEKTFQATMDKQELNNRSSALAMLSKDRLDIFLDSQSDLKSEIQEKKVDVSAYRIEELLKRPIHIGFAENERGQQLKKIFDEGFTKLIQSGKAKQLYEKWKWTYIPTAN